jgi:hypothetical protein
MNQNPLFPGGTLAMQAPFFHKLGLDISNYHQATLNVSIEPYDIEILKPDWHFERVRWHPTEPPEDFSFIKITAAAEKNGPFVSGLIYYPHPETKPAHHQPKGLIEILLKNFVEDLAYGAMIWLEILNDQVRLIKLAG